MLTEIAELARAIKDENGDPGDVIICVAGRTADAVKRAVETGAFVIDRSNAPWSIIKVHGIQIRFFHG